MVTPPRRSGKAAGRGVFFGKGCTQLSFCALNIACSRCGESAPEGVCAGDVLEGDIPEVIIAQSARMAGARGAYWGRVSQWMRAAKAVA